MNCLRWLETKIFALLSIAFACVLIYYSNFFKILYEHDKIDNFYFILSIICYTISLSIFLFLSVYLPYFRNIHEDQWEIQYPNMIPTATLTGLIGMISLIISIWNVWGWLSIILVLGINLLYLLWLFYRVYFLIIILNMKGIYIDLDHFEWYWLLF